MIRLGHKIDVAGIREVVTFGRQLCVNLGRSPQRKLKPPYEKNTATCKSVHVCCLNIKTCATQYGLWWWFLAIRETDLPHTINIQNSVLVKQDSKIQVYALVCKNTFFLVFLKESNKVIKTPSSNFKIQNGRRSTF